jgi:hypothetical protein
MELIFMKRDLILWQVGGLTFTAVLGTLLHFLYDWVKIPIIAPFSALNESTWEHMKILFFPMLFYAVIQYFFFKDEYESFWCVKFSGCLIGLILIPVLFYTFNGAFGKTPDWVNIAIFFISAGIAYLYEYNRFKTKPSCKGAIFAFIALTAVAVLFIVFSYFPPKIPLFKDPISGLYGI